MTQRMQKNNKRNRKSRKVIRLIILELIVLLLLFGAYRIYILVKSDDQKKPNNQSDISQDNDDQEDDTQKDDEKDELSEEERKALEEQEKLKQEEQDRQQLIAQADLLALGYDYDAAIELIKGYTGNEGSYNVYTILTEAIGRLEQEKSELLLYGGSYQSVKEFNHVFFHSLVADNSLAFDGDRDAVGYNMYMTTIYEFNKILEKMYADGYVLVRMADLVKQETSDDNTTKYVENEIYLREGKKPFLISVDDVSYYPYMDGDGFASRIIIGEDGKPTCEMLLTDGTVVTGDFDVVPILDAFVEEHPDFSYKGAKGLLAVTGYEGVLGYRTNDPASPTYEADKVTAKKVADALKEDGWEFGSHSWGHKNMQTITIDHLKRDTDRWMEEVNPLIGPTEVYVFPFGVDIERTMGNYATERYTYLKNKGFNIFVGVDKKPWMQIKTEYVRVTRRPLDGQAMLEFPERLVDLFQIEEVLDPERPAKDW